MFADGKNPSGQGKYEIIAGQIVFDRDEPRLAPLYSSASGLLLCGRHRPRLALQQAGRGREPTGLALPFRSRLRLRREKIAGFALSWLHELCFVYTVAVLSARFVS